MTQAVTAKVAVATKAVNTVKNQWNPETEKYDREDTNASVTLYADYANGANKEWASATPSLSISMILNGAVEGFFEPGAKYTLTFTRDEVAS